MIGSDIDTQCDWSGKRSCRLIQRKPCSLRGHVELIQQRLANGLRIVEISKIVIELILAGVAGSPAPAGGGVLKT